MGAKGERLAKQWPVGAVAHHIASSHVVIAGLVETLADGKPGPSIPMDAIHAMNAKHAEDFASCTKPETIALLRKNAAAAAGMLRGIGDAELDRSGTVLIGMPPVSAGQLAGGLLCSHVDEHLGSIRATVGG